MAGLSAIAIFATVIEYIFFTTCHCLSGTIIYLSLLVIAGKKEHRLALFAGKSKLHLDLVDTCFTPTSSRVTGQSTSGSAHMRLSFSVLSQTYVRADEEVT